MRIGIFISSILASAAISDVYALSMQAFSSKLTPLGLIKDADQFSPLDDHASNNLAETNALTET